jgi:SAM-dependent methyltransferase
VSEDADRLNVAWWDERAALHGDDGMFYDVEAFLAGRSALSERELAEISLAVGDVAGLDVLHLHCHLGMGTLSLARLGAHVTGVDFSPVAIDRARSIAEIAGIDARFVTADARSLPDELADGFDLVFASYGVVMSIDSLAAWMSSAARACRPGGALVIVEGHPIQMLVTPTDPPRLSGPYQGGAAVEREEHGDYAVGDVSTVNDRAVLYRWGLGDVVSAAANAGFVVEALTEWLEEPGSGSGALMRDDEIEPATLEVAGARLPTTYGLRARRA